LYWGIDIEAIYGFIHENLEDLKKFEQMVVEFLKLPIMPILAILVICSPRAMTWNTLPGSITWIFHLPARLA